jgi:hypothetical protein
MLALVIKKLRAIRTDRQVRLLGSVDELGKRPRIHHIDPIALILLNDLIAHVGQCMKGIALSLLDAITGVSRSLSSQSVEKQVKGEFRVPRKTPRYKISLNKDSLVLVLHVENKEIVRSRNRMLNNSRVNSLERRRSLI